MDKYNLQPGLSRRDVLIAGAATLAAWPLQAASRDDWRSGDVAHLLPAVNHDSLLLKASFLTGQQDARLLVDGRSHKGHQTDSGGRYWTFQVSGLPADTRLLLQLASGVNGGRIPGQCGGVKAGHFWRGTVVCKKAPDRGPFCKSASAWGVRLG